MGLISLSGSRRRAAWLLAAAGFALTLALFYVAVRTPPIPHGTLRIGYEHVPPVQMRTDSGPTGLAVETVNEAAKRAGVPLRWVETGTSSDEAFRLGLVDLWPVMADLPERRKRVHITRPWLHNNHSLVLGPGSPPPDRSFAGRIAVFKMPIHLRLVRQGFPSAELLQLPDFREIVREVCKGTVSAGLLEDRAALAVLQDKPAECASVTLRVATPPNLTLDLGVASTFEAAGAADAIRGEIGNLFRDGTLAVTMAKYSYYGLVDEWSTYDLINAAEHARWVAWGVGFLGIVLAVTVWQTASLRQRKRSEAALRASEERFRSIFHQAAVGDAEVSLGGVVAMVNDRFCEVMGHPREELVGKKLIARADADDCAALLAKRERLLAGESASYSLEMRTIRHDGRIAWVKLHESVVRDGSRLPQCTIAVVEDITERRQSEAALRESEERFRSMADTVPAMIWVSGVDKRCTFFNHGWLSFTGATLEQATGNGWSNMIHAGDRERCFARYSTAFDARSAFQTECRMRRWDGEYRWVLATGAPRFESGGVFAGYVGSCTDITDVKRAQEEAIASQKLEGLGVLAGGIAHDFNNLLGSILANSELVLSELPGTSPAYQGVESIKYVADRAAGIVGQLLAYAGRENPECEQFELSQLVNEMLELLKVSISKRAHLSVDLPEDLPPIQANAAQIRQVVMNLIMNASEALEEQEGVISISLALVHSRTEKEHLLLTVSDTGCGMTEETQGRIFDPFFTTKFAGRGLGLAAAQGIVRGHGGTIHVISAPGQGSRFEIALPCVSRPAGEGGRTAAPAVAGNTARVAGNVLVVEDEAELRSAISKMLRKQDFSVIEAGDGHAGVELFRRHQEEIDVVLLDLTLPGIAGREVLEELRRMQPDVKVIITTAYSQDTALRTLGGQQPWLYLRKPYRIGDVTDMLRKVCSQAAARGRAVG